MKIVLDTNVLLMALKKSSHHRPIFQKLLLGDYFLVITSDILLEYIEIIGQKTNAQVANNLGDLLLNLNNVIKTEVSFNWLLITQDPDDDKYVDAAVSGNTDYIVTNDKHFNVLKLVEFPSVKICDADEFLEMLKKEYD